MNKEQKTCQNCHSEFWIEPEDFDFYKKIDVPPPTFCPDCRLQRRLSFFNIMTLYKGVCDLCGENIISRYAPESSYTVYCPKCWWSDEWSPFDYGKEYDASRPFLEQMYELWKKVPLLSLSVNKDIIGNSPYVNHMQFSKNCYFIFVGSGDEDCAYGFYVHDSRFVFDSGPIMNSEFCYDSMHAYKCNKCVGARSQVTESVDCYFLRDCMNCQDCFASANLRGKKYYIFNKPYSKESYFNEIKKWDLGSYEGYKKAQKMAEAHWRTLPPKPSMDEFTTDCTGSHVFQAKNCKDCFEVVGAENCKYLFAIKGPIRESYDISRWGENQELCYECSTVGDGASRAMFSEEAGHDISFLEYCKLSTSGSHHLGCVSVRKSDYCILNKRYSKEAFNELRERIIKDMDKYPYVDKKGREYRYGEFFPAEFSPFPYNTTVAQYLFPLSKDDAYRQGYVWNDVSRGEYAVTKNASVLPDHIKNADDSIVKEIIGCASCGYGFKIIPAELQFLKNMGLPLPRECPQCRVGSKFRQWVKNLRVIPRTCNRCSAEFSTNYTKDDAPIVLCKECYKKETI